MSQNCIGKLITDFRRADLRSGTSGRWGGGALSRKKGPTLLFDREAGVGPEEGADAGEEEDAGGPEARPLRHPPGPRGAARRREPLERRIKRN